MTFAGVPAAVEQWGTSQVVVHVPSAGTAGPVVLTNAQGSSNGLTFGTGPSPSPSPSPGPAPGGLRLRGLLPRWGIGSSAVRLSGTGFGSTAGTVRIQGASVSVLSWTATWITLRIEGSNRGRHSIQIVTAAGQMSNALDFRQTR